VDSRSSKLSVRTNLFTEQATTGVLLANTKMEEFRTTLNIANLPPGGGLDATAPTVNHFEYLSISDAGVITADTVTTTAPYLRLWQISGSNPRLVTVSVYAQNSGISGDPIELVRTTTELTNGF
jgi:hypothetical protein